MLCFLKRNITINFFLFSGSIFSLWGYQDFNVAAVTNVELEKKMGEVFNNKFFQELHQPLPLSSRGRSLLEDLFDVRQDLLMRKADRFMPPELANRSEFIRVFVKRNFKEEIVENENVEDVHYVVEVLEFIAALWEFRGTAYSSMVNYFYTAPHKLPKECLRIEDDKARFLAIFALIDSKLNALKSTNGLNIFFIKNARNFMFMSFLGQVVHTFANAEYDLSCYKNDE